jgi:hypothetical protein
MSKRRFKTDPFSLVRQVGHYFCVLVFATSATLSVGCGASGAEVRDRQLKSLDEVGPAEILYGSIIDEMTARKWPVATASDKMLLVAGEFQHLDPQLRHRMVSQVLTFPNGVALNVKSEYQRLDRTMEPPDWVEAADVGTLTKARSDEAEFGAAVQSRFAQAQ